MSSFIVTGSSGLIGAECVQQLCEAGHKVYGIDNNMRKQFFGENGSTAHVAAYLSNRYVNFEHIYCDIRDAGDVYRIFERVTMEGNLQGVIHTAAQPSHDKAAEIPLVDFSVNANGTMNLLEATRRFAPYTHFVHMSTSKVYGGLPNHIPLVSRGNYWWPTPSDPYSDFGIDEHMSVDQSTHSLFGASKLAADIMVQEYGRYYGVRTVVLRPGCLTGPGHAGVEQHGFLSYLVKCAACNERYTIHGYSGMQVRDNISAYDLTRCILEILYDSIMLPGSVYIVGGGMQSWCSVNMAIKICEDIIGGMMKIEYSDKPRKGDHMWWVGDTRKFRSQFPSWGLRDSGTRKIIEGLFAGDESTL